MHNKEFNIHTTYVFHSFFPLDSQLQEKQHAAAVALLKEQQQVTIGLTQPIGSLPLECDARHNRLKPNRCEIKSPPLSIMSQCVATHSIIVFVPFAKNFKCQYDSLSAHCAHSFRSRRM